MKIVQNNHREFVVTFDGMQVAEGSKNKSDGDVDLWGAEGNPSIKGAAQRLEQDLTSCKKLDKQLHNSNLDCHYLHVENTML